MIKLFENLLTVVQICTCVQELKRNVYVWANLICLLDFHLMAREYLKSQPWLFWLNIINNESGSHLLLFQINIDPESLKPKLPSRKDLKPYPTTCYLEYKGHKGPVVSISTDSTGQWIASGWPPFFLQFITFLFTSNVNFLHFLILYLFSF